jgi:hypothetical protein
MEASEEDRQKVKKAILAGRIEWSEEAKESLASMDRQNPDFTVIDIDLHCWGKFNNKEGEQVNQGGFDISWRTKSAGFGHMIVYIDNDGKIKCQDEGMGKTFLKDVLNKLIDKIELDD